MNAYSSMDSPYAAGSGGSHTATTPVPVVSDHRVSYALHAPMTPDIDLDAYKRNVGAQRLIAHINMISQIAGGILGALMTAAMSTLSDRADRCKVLALGMLSMAVRQLCFILVCRHPQSMVSTGGAILCVGPVSSKACLGEHRCSTPPWQLISRMSSQWTSCRCTASASWSSLLL